jgi:hypothetical protein
VVSADVVTWTQFSQEHRPERDYEGFGPFVFGRAPYAAAVATAIEAVD